MSQFFILCAGVLLFSVNLNTQNDSVYLPPSQLLIDSIKTHLLHIHSGQYVITHRFKWFSNDTMEAPQVDTVYFEQHPTSNSYKQLYSIAQGQKTIYALSDSIIIANHATQQYEIILDTHQIQSSYREQYVFQPLSLNFWSKASIEGFDTTWIEHSTVSDSYILHLFIANGQGFRNAHMTVTLSEINYLPIGYTFRVEFENMYQYAIATIDDLSLLYDPKAPSRFQDSIQYYQTHYTEWVRPPRTSSNNKPTIQVGQTLDNFGGITSCGANFQLQQNTASLILLDFWYKGCYPCIKAVPTINALHQKYQQAGLLVLGINHSDALHTIQDYETYKGIDYCTLPSKDLVKRLGINGFPTFILLDQKGNILEIVEGYSTNLEKELEALIQRHL